jgi:hypothetical protein
MDNMIEKKISNMSLRNYHTSLKLNVKAVVDVEYAHPDSGNRI